MNYNLRNDKANVDKKRVSLLVYLAFYYRHKPNYRGNSVESFSVYPFVNVTAIHKSDAQRMPVPKYFVFNNSVSLVLERFSAENRNQYPWQFHG